MPRFSRQQIHYSSRSPRVLANLVVFILASSLLIAYALSTFNRWQAVRAVVASPLVSQLEMTFTGPDAGPAKIARELRRIHDLIRERYEDSPDPQSEMLFENLSLTALEDLLAKAPLDASQRRLFVAYLQARFGDGEPMSEGRSYLATHAPMKPPLRFANEFLGDILSDDGELEKALEHYEIEAQFADAEYARRQAVALAIQLDDVSKLRQFTADEDFRRAFGPRQKIDRALLLRDWLGLATAVVAYDYQFNDLPQRLLALFAAAIWFVIVIQFGHYSHHRMAFYVLGIIAGILSSSTTLYVLILQENVGGMNTGANLIEEVIYFVVGVGLREEVIKLAWFLPFLPFLLKRRDDLEALLVAACVGLGFALQENVNYYRGAGGSTVALSRFVTANFFHLAATGLLGLACYRLCRAPKRAWEEFLATFIGVVLIHGAYNSLLSIEELEEYSILYIVVFVLLAQRFFQQAGALRDANSHAISPLAVFLVGSALLGGVVINYATWHEPFFSALLGIGFALVGVVPIAFVFINQFKND